MTVKLSQGMVDRARDDHPPGTALHDAEVSGLRLICGKTSASFKLVGRINDGTKRYVSLTIGRADEVSLKTARERALGYRAQLRRGEDPRRPRPGTIPTLWEQWEKYRKARGDELRPDTVVWYESKLRGPLRSLLDLPMDRITREDVANLHERITSERGSYAANGSMRTVKLLHTDCARIHELPPNPVKRAVRMNREHRRDDALGDAGMTAMWRALDAMEDRTRATCWEVLLFTGLRVGDVVSMRWEDLDDEGVLRLPCPKGGERRAFSIPLPRHLLQRLEGVRQETAKMESAYVFPSPTGRCRHVSKLRRTEEFPYNPKVFRHNYRTVAVEASLDMQTVMLLMNHKEGSVSFGYVTRAQLVGTMRTAQESIAAAVLSRR